MLLNRPGEGFTDAAFVAKRVHIDSMADSAIANAVNVVLGTNLVLFSLDCVLRVLGDGNRSDLPRLSRGFRRFLRQTSSE